MNLIYNLTSVVTTYVYYAVPILVGIIISIIIKRNKDERKTIAHEVVMRVPLHNRFSLAWAFVSFLFYLVILIRVFIPQILNIHNILAPEYVNKWYELLWVNNIRNLIHQFLYTGVINEATSLIRYNDYLVLFIVSNSLLFIIIYFIYQGLQKAFICENRLYAAGKMFKWNDFQSVKLVEPSINKKNERRYILQLLIKDTKIRHNYSSPLNTLELQVTLEEKEKIYDLIEAINNQITLD
ncbi:hypothetical protein F8154_01740 [Alkaliphilus pronyensis]|uniref:DUF5673 domain-containing protein n=1 Tax=Alkaliphilus pronyensis TaxID=1482732 RepID=A0A6I0FHD5_9FIRM|nr:hypothetical protein [Alkaliphilus pronyensis]KAB3538636.1 hypothetical protein F8154_01740 [Alkaliphilus pronyensis]